MKRKSERVLSALLLLAVILIPLSGFAEERIPAEEQTPYSQFSLIEATEPVISPYPFMEDANLTEGGDKAAGYREWWQARYEHQATPVKSIDKIHSFTKDSARFILSGNDNTNAVYSPIDIWFCLELLSNLTGGNSRAQVLDLLGTDAESGSGVGDETLYRAVYWDDGLTVCRPSSSLWIDQRTHLSDNLAKVLAANCHASVYRGPMGEQVFDEAYRAWLNEKTNCLLKDIVNELKLSQDDSVSLCTTLYLRSSWSLPFDRNETHIDVFYAYGGETTTDFMSKEESGGTVYRGAGFSSVIMDLQDGSYVTFVLPDSDKRVDEVLQSDGLFELLFAGREWTDKSDGTVRIAMPKIDILTEAPLREMLVHMGVTDIFDPEKTAFSKEITSEGDLKLSSLKQFSHLIVNEEGIEAASIVVSAPTSLLIPLEEEFDFILNRPFIFAVFTRSNIPLFIGVYYTP